MSHINTPGVLAEIVQRTGVDMKLSLIHIWDRWSVLGRTDFQCYWRYGMFCNHVAYNLAKAERRKLLFAVTEKIDNMAKKEIDNQRDTDYNEFILSLIHI